MKNKVVISVLLTLFVLYLTSCASNIPLPEEAWEGPRPTIVKTIWQTPIRIYVNDQIARDGLSECTGLDVRPEHGNMRLAVYLPEEFDKKGRLCLVQLSSGAKYYFKFFLAEAGEKTTPYIRTIGGERKKPATLESELEKLE